MLLLRGTHSKGPSLPQSLSDTYRNNGSCSSYILHLAADSSNPPFNGNSEADCVARTVGTQKYATDEQTQ